MYFWKTKKLAEEIRSDSISEQTWMKYFLAWIIFITLSQYVMSASPYENTNAMLVEIIGIVGVIIFGVSITFKTNLIGSGTAQNYFCRVTALSIPIMIKIIVLMIGVGITFGIIEDVLSLPLIDNTWLMSVLAIAIEILYFWRINVHIAYINT